MPPLGLAEYRSPNGLCTAQSPINRILVVGQCLVEWLADYIKDAGDGVDTEFILLNNAAEMPALNAEYDLQVLSIALRSIVPDLAHANLPYNHPEAFDALFAECCQKMEFLLNSGTSYADRMPIFVTNLLVPQQNTLGRLVGRRDLRNFSYFVRQLNERLEDMVEARSNCYILDVEDINRTSGAMGFQDDVLWLYSHGAALSDYDHVHDQRRLHPPAPISSRITLATDVIAAAIWAEIKAQYVALKRFGVVKLVIIDLDDTLWRGILAEQDSVPPTTVEGWPLGVAEALLYLKQRGIVLAIASKNDESRIRELWRLAWADRLKLEDFSSIRINWLSKAQNVGEIIEDVNVLPESVVFIDDNPVERASIESAFPGVRTLGADPYEIRRTLLWAAETQPAVMTEEAACRAAMVFAQVEREKFRKTMSRQDFLDSLQIEYTPVVIKSASDPKFERAFELLNKTNQFNTTGKRWERQEITKALKKGLELHAFEVRDRYTSYGLVGMAVLQGSVIEQFVMSCRVIGLDVELRCLEKLKIDRGPLTAKFMQTSNNGACRDLYIRVGIAQEISAFLVSDKNVVNEL